LHKTRHFLFWIDQYGHCPEKEKSPAICDALSCFGKLKRHLIFCSVVFEQVLLALKTATIRAFLITGEAFLCADLNMPQGTVVLAAAMVLTALDITADTVIDIIHLVHSPFCGFYRVRDFA